MQKLRKRLAPATAVRMMACCLGLLLLLQVGGCSNETAVDPGVTNAGDEDGGLRELVGNIQVDGSSTVFPISEAIASAFRDDFPNVSVPVGTSGTGGGFERFTNGDIDISGASRPIKWSEFEQAKANQISFIELPVAYDGLTIVVNPANDWVDQLTLDDIRKIFLEDQAAKTWKDVKQNWPDEPIKIFAPGTDSGTFDYFKEVVAGKEGSLRADMSPSEDDNQLVTGVKEEKGAVGFFGASYYFNNRDVLRAVPIVNPDTGKAVMPVAKDVESGTYAPFSRPLFIYVKEDSLRRPEVKKFVEFYLKNAAEMAEKVDYVPLPAELYERARKHYEERLVGTHYWIEGGEEREGALAQVYDESNLLSVSSN